VTPERWQKITALFVDALARDRSERDAFLAEACGGDTALRSDVDRLLRAQTRAGRFLETSIEPLHLTAGTRFGFYEIIGLLGTGGMGEVYRARDSALGRDVALKFLPPHLAADPKRQELFAREARAIAAINHPHIVTIHAIEKEGARPFLVMELVEGRTLTDLIPREGLPVDRFFDIAIALAEAIGAAHEKGIVHRDLKPGNVMIRTDGRVKILDFGISALAAAAPLMAVSVARTTVAQTLAGKLVGTPSYMSPEQAEARQVDHRTDLFSLGIVLFELITGQHPFHGDSDVAILSSILRETPPPINVLNRHAPVGLVPVLDRLLAKNPEQRYQSATDLRRDLEDVRASLEIVQTNRVARRNRTVIAAALFGTFAAIAWWVAVRGFHESVSTGAAVAVRQLTSDDGIEAQPDISADGNWLAYAKANDIWLRKLGDAQSVDLTMDQDGLAEDPAFSPDGRRIAYSSSDKRPVASGGVWLMDTTGGSKHRLSEFGFEPTWSPDGHEIVFTTVPSNPFLRPGRSRMIAADVVTGATRLLISGDSDGWQPAFSPHAKRIAYARMWIPGRPVVQRDIWTMAVSGGEPVRVTDDAFFDWSPVWSPDGRYVYFCSDRSGSWNVWRVAVDETTGGVLGSPEPVPTPARTRSISLATDGQRFVYEASETLANIQKAKFDPESETVVGQPAAVTSGTRTWADVDVSSDGRLLFWSTLRQEDIHVSDSEGRQVKAVAPDPSNDRFARWSPDGEWIAFSSMKSNEGNYEIFMMRPDGSELQRLTFLGKSAAAFFPLWSPDGKRLAFTTGAAGGALTHLIELGHAWAMPSKAWLTPPGDPAALYRPWSWSPDGRWIIAYADRGAGMIVYSTATEGVRRVSQTGDKPRWMSDSRRVVYVDAGKLMLLDVESGKSHELYALNGEAIVDPAISRDDRTIYFIRQRNEGDIWMGTLSTK